MTGSQIPNQNTDKKNQVEKAATPAKVKDAARWRDLTAYWILGLCNNYGYVVMLSAAHDIIERFGNGHHNEQSLSPDVHIEDSGRVCNIVSTGAILLADILPSFAIKLLGPFLPFFINFRVFMACLLQMIGFLMVAFADSEWMAILGVVLTSLSSGLGEASFLAYSSEFHKNVISSWSSGTGGAGIVGSLSYAGLIALGLSPVNTMLIMLLVPIGEGIAFWVLLRNPKNIPRSNDSVGSSATASTTEVNDVATVSAAVDMRDYEIEEIEKPLTSLGDKIRYVPQLFKYMIPISLVYLFEYFINQGLFELIYFPNIWLDQRAQYRWLQVDYQIGVFISRSSVNIFKIKKIWLMAVLQLINVIYFFVEVKTYFTPSIWIVFATVLWEGLLGGGAYVNTFYLMSKEVPASRRKFALGVVPVADSIGIALAGFLAMPVHNAICRLPAPIRT